jgi:DNA-binding MarR family transcriptional regulator
MAAATSIMRAQQIVLARVDEALRPFELTFARYEALVLLTFSRRGSLPLGKMGERLMIHPTSVTNIVDRLQAQGLVERVSHPTDRRTTLCEITAAGRQIVAAATEAVIAIDLGIVGLTDREVAQLTKLLGKLRLESGDFDA